MGGLVSNCNMAALQLNVGDTKETRNAASFLRAANCR